MTSRSARCLRERYIGCQLCQTVDDAVGQIADGVNPAEAHQFVPAPTSMFINPTTARPNAIGIVSPLRMSSASTCAT